MKANHPNSKTSKPAAKPKKRRNVGSKGAQTAKPKRTVKPKEVDPALPEFFSGIRRRRMEAGMTLDEMSEGSALTPNYIGTVENGYRDPSLSTLEAIAKGLRTPLGELFGPKPTLSPGAMAMAKLFEGAPEALQIATLRLLYAIIKRNRGES